MKVVMLGSVTSTFPHMSRKTHKLYETEVVYRLQGYILDIGMIRKNPPLYESISELTATSGINYSLVFSPEMFVTYNDYFSEVPTQAEIDNFAMIHGFIPCLIEI